MPELADLADQLTLFQPGRADYPHLLLLAPPNVFHLPASLQTLVGLCTTLQISTMGYCSYLSGVNQKCAHENNNTQ